MKIDLGKIFTSYLDHSAIITKSGKNIDIDKKFNTLTLLLDENVKIEIVSDISKYAVAYNYNDLQPLELSKDDQDIIKKHEPELAKNPNFYNGKHIILTNIVWDIENNIIYLEARQISFVALSALQNELFSKDSKLSNMPLYETGSAIPCITRDKYTVLFERQGGNYSSNAGFCEPGADGTLGAPNYDLGLFELTAMIELIEELLGDETESERFKEFLNNKNNSNFFNDFQNFSRINFTTPKPLGISIHKLSNNLIVTDFILPVNLNCDIKELIELLKSIRAKDKNEHTANYEIMSLKTMSEMTKFLNQNKPGKFAYDSIILTLLNLIVENFDIQAFVRNSNIESFSIHIDQLK